MAEEGSKWRKPPAAAYALRRKLKRRLVKPAAASKYTKGRNACSGEIEKAAEKWKAGQKWLLSYMKARRRREAYRTQQLIRASYRKPVICQLIRKSLYHYSVKWKMQWLSWRRRRENYVSVFYAEEKIEEKKWREKINEGLEADSIWNLRRSNISEKPISNAEEKRI